MVKILIGLKTEKTTIKSVHYNENLRKSSSKTKTKVCPNSDQRGQTKFKKLLCLKSEANVQAESLQPPYLKELPIATILNSNHILCAKVNSTLINVP